MLPASADFATWRSFTFVASGVAPSMLLAVKGPPRLTPAAPRRRLTSALVTPGTTDFASFRRRHMLSGSMVVSAGAALGFLGIALAQSTRQVWGVHGAYRADVVDRPV